MPFLPAIAAFSFRRVTQVTQVTRFFRIIPKKRVAITNARENTEKDLLSATKQHETQRRIFHHAARKQSYSTLHGAVHGEARGKTDRESHELHKQNPLKTCHPLIALISADPEIFSATEGAEFSEKG